MKQTKAKVFFLYNPFTKHPNTVGETYFEHMWQAFKFFCILLRLTIVVLVHSVFPFLFEFTTSSRIKKLNNYMQSRINSTKPDNGTEYHTYFPAKDFDLPTHEEIKNAEKKND